MCFTSYNEGNTRDYWFNLKGEVLDLNGNQVTDDFLLKEAKRYIDYKHISKVIQKINYFSNDN